MFVPSSNLFRRNLFNYLYKTSRQSSSHNKLLVNDTNIAYTTAGTGHNVALMLPGALGSGQLDFKPQFAALPSEDITLVTWDPPGYGDSRPHVRQYGEDFLKNDAQMAAKLMEELGYKSYSVLGWSDGGITGLILAAMNPAVVKKLAVWGSNAYLGEKDVEIYKGIRDISVWSERMRAPMEKMYGPEGFKTLWEGWIDAMINIHQKKDGDLCREMLKYIACPTLILHGVKDFMVPEEHGHYLRENIQNSRLEHFEDGKHNFHLKYAVEFNARVKSFLLDNEKEFTFPKFIPKGAVDSKL